MSYTFTMPIYWVNEKKTKKSTTHLIGMNFYRNAHYHIKNKLKSDVEQCLHDQATSFPRTPHTKFTTHYKLYYKTASCDPSNIIALMEKFFLDFAQQANIVKQDNMTAHISSSWEVVEQDKLNPRCEVVLTPTKESQ